MAHYTIAQAKQHAINVRNDWPKKKGNKKVDIDTCARWLRKFGLLHRYCEFIEICKDMNPDQKHYVPGLENFCKKQIGSMEYGLEYESEEEWQEFLAERKKMYHRKDWREAAKESAKSRDGDYNRGKDEKPRPRKRKIEEDIPEDFFS